MNQVNVVERPQKRLQKVFIRVAFTFAAIAVLSTIAHFIWKSAGANQWKLEKDVDGVKVYSLKTPGETVKKYKVVGRFQSRLSPIMKVMRDPGACDDVGCYESYIIETIEYPRYVYYTFRYPMPSPFKPREYVVLSEFHQDPKSKEIYVDYKAATHKLEPNDCCVRVTHMHNKWRFIPLENGEVEVQLIMDHDPGGLLPYFLTNMMMSSEIHLNIPDLQAVLNKDEYKNAVVDYVQEVDSEADVSSL